MVPGHHIVDAAVIIGELKFWREILRQASQAHDELPPSAQREIERRASDDELLGQIPVLAMLSTYTRQRIEGTLSAALLLLSEHVTGDGDLPQRHRQMILRLVNGDDL